jgi:hypothetical protein
MTLRSTMMAFGNKTFFLFSLLSIRTAFNAEEDADITISIINNPQISLEKLCAEYQNLELLFSSYASMPRIYNTFKLKKPDNKKRINAISIQTLNELIQASHKDKNHFEEKCHLIAKAMEFKKNFLYTNQNLFSGLYKQSQIDIANTINQNNIANLEELKFLALISNIETFIIEDKESNKLKCYRITHTIPTEGNDKTKNQYLNYYVLFENNDEKNTDPVGMLQVAYYLNKSAEEQKDPYAFITFAGTREPFKKKNVLLNLAQKITPGILHKITTNHHKATIMTWIKSEQASHHDQSEYLRPVYEQFFKKIFAKFNPIIVSTVIHDTPYRENFTVKLDLKNKII